MTERWKMLALVVVAACGDGEGGDGDGSGDTDAASDTEVLVACDGEDSQTVACGLNGAGTKSQTCVDGFWRDDGACADPDVCVNDDTRDETCGLNDRGALAQRCVDGQWQDEGACVDPDTCVDGAPIEDACDLACVEGQPTLLGQRYTQVVVGAAHTCALEVNGDVWCWGDDGAGQLGDGAPEADKDVPTRVTGAAGAIALAAGDFHTCALLVDGTASCWGSDTSGQLGDGAGTTDQPAPVPVSGLTDVRRIVAGANHTCAIRADGRAWCWGNDGSGQVGDGGGTSASQPVPVAVSSITNVTEIAAGALHTCALRAGDTYACWGDDTYAQLGNGDQVTSAQSAPFAQPGTKGFSSLAAGTLHNCARDNAGELGCWGDGTVAQIGYLGTMSTSHAVGDILAFSALEAGSLHTCFVRPDGTAACFGLADDGRLGNGATSGTQEDPVAVAGLTDVVQLAAGDLHTCALSADGTIHCWGDDGSGQLGNGPTTGVQPTPVLVAGQADPSDCGVVQVDAGWGAAPSACALLADGTVRCWGDDAEYKLGDGDTTTGAQAAGVAVTGVADAVQIAVGELAACARTADTHIRCWGNYLYRGSGVSVPSLGTQNTVTDVASFVDVTMGPTHGCAVDNIGKVWCWGKDDLGQIGNGTTTGNQVTPSTVASLVDAVDVEAGRGFSCARRANGTVSCWGDDTSGQLGNGGGVTSATSPVAVAGLTNAVALALGGAHGCALRSDGKVLCWGSDTLGQRGDGAGTSDAQGNASVVAGVEDAVAISAGESTTCAKLADGRVLCWGTDANGERGDGPGVTDPQAAPTELVTDAGVRGLGLGQGFGCAVRTSGRPACWGLDDVGQLGNGDATGTAESASPASWTR